MNLRPAFFAFLMAVVIACWVGVRAQQQTQADPTQITEAATQIALRSEHLKPLFEQVHPTEWVAGGAPEAYVAQWNSLLEQNQAIATDMANIGQRTDAMQDIMKALFRVHRFDSDLDSLLRAVGRYQNPALADLIGSVAVEDQSGVERAQQYVLDLAGEKERALDVVNTEAQRCRATLAAQPVVRPPAQKKAVTK